MAAEPPVQVVRVCDVLKDVQSYAGRPLAIVGRFSFREDNGRFLSEANCGAQANSGDSAWPTVLRLAFNTESAPKPPQPMVLDEQAILGKLKEVRKATALREFRFGSPDYDRWALVFGRIDPVKEFTAHAKPAAVQKDGLGPAPADLVCRGDGVIVFLDNLR